MLPRPFRCTPGIAVAVLATLLFVRQSSPAEEFAPVALASGSAVPLIHPPGLNAVVRIAALEAYRRMGSDRCREIFSEFRDASGRTLQESLDSVGRTGQSYFEWLWFVDAHAGGRCVQTDVLVFTVPGSRVISYCGDRFTRQLSRRGLGSLAALLIHEELHSLGLGENPPSSDEITRHVESRCGS